MACVIGALVYCLCDRLGAETIVSQITCSVFIFIVRTLAVKYNICLPVLNGDDEYTEGNK